MYSTHSRTSHTLWRPHFDNCRPHRKKAQPAKQAACSNHSHALHTVRTHIAHSLNYCRQHGRQTQPSLSRHLQHTCQRDTIPAAQAAGNDHNDIAYIGQMVAWEAGYMSCRRRQQDRAQQHKQPTTLAVTARDTLSSLSTLKQMHTCWVNVERCHHLFRCCLWVC